MRESCLCDVHDLCSWWTKGGGSGVVASNHTHTTRTHNRDGTDNMAKRPGLSDACLASYGSRGLKSHASLLHPSSSPPRPHKRWFSSCPSSSSHHATLSRYKPPRKPALFSTH
jgi:hypothetical protein